MVITTEATSREPTTHRAAAMVVPGAAPLTHVVLRVGAGLLFFQHGAQKLLGWFGGAGPDGGTVPLLSLIGLAGVLELFGGILIAIGLFTRPVALILGVEMAVAFVYAHLPQGWVPIVNGGELALLYMIVFLFLAANGPGPASVDGAFHNRRHKVEIVPRSARVS